MKYILLHNLDDLLKEKTLDGYLNEGYKIVFEDTKNLIIKNTEDKILDEDKYIKITISIINRSNINKSSIIDLSDAFNYAKSKGKYNIFNNKFDCFIRKEIIQSFNTN